ncbi:MAG: hypothetical protein J2P54_25075, partial [Bradyrhizobiaceae bacterium]|nr:hypothetical protein [Bradyrhizobiaceae bacterium]
MLVDRGMVRDPDGLVLFVAEKTALALAGHGHRGTTLDSISNILTLTTVTLTRTFRSAIPACFASLPLCGRAFPAFFNATRRLHTVDVPMNEFGAPALEPMLKR